ncbi:metal ABC transporter permease, partial [Sinorhizobium sp. 6-117]|uniref:metal ABC transporter permease n=1 Tax=Sinorhizobium sp. 6-117 TaxID=3049090 RepID=UPI0024C426DA
MTGIIITRNPRTCTITIRTAAAAITRGSKASNRRRSAMLDDFFIRALVAGIGIAMVAGPLGCFVIWRRMAYFGDTMAHSALLGVALSLLLELNLMISVFIVASVVSLLLLFLQK